MAKCGVSSETILRGWILLCQSRWKGFWELTSWEVSEARLSVVTCTFSASLSNRRNRALLLLAAHTWTDDGYS